MMRGLAGKGNLRDSTQNGPFTFQLAPSPFCAERRTSLMEITSRKVDSLLLELLRGPLAVFATRDEGEASFKLAPRGSTGSE
jgi:hypothetical protein